MSPRKRSNKGQDSNKNAQTVDSQPKDADSSETGENTEEYPRFQPSIYSRRRPSDGVRWFPVVKRIFYVSLLVLVPMILNYAALNHEMRVLPPKGAVMYDIGWGQKLLLHCTGSGLPTVVLEAPIGQPSYIWSKVQPILAKHTRVCSYDRAGLGFSDRAYQNTSKYTEDYGNATKERDKTLPSTVERMVEDLHRLLTVASNQPKPFLLVGLDFMTLVTRFYAQLYEHDLMGILLIDPAPETLFEADPPSPSTQRHSSEDGEEDEHLDSEELLETPWTHHWYRNTVPHLQSVHLSGSLGFNRVGLMAGLMSPLEVPQLSNILTDDLIAIKKHLLCQPKHLLSAFDEYYFMNESVSQIKTVLQIKPFPDLPTKIATFKTPSETLPQELTKIWRREQQRMVMAVHPDSHQTTLPGSDHLSLYQHPEAVAKSVLDLVREWKVYSRTAAEYIVDQYHTQ